MTLLYRVFINIWLFPIFNLIENDLCEGLLPILQVILCDCAQIE